PRALERLKSFVPDRPLPKIFRLTKGGALVEGVFEGATINTPSMWAVADFVDALDWAGEVGGLPGLHARADANAAALQGWVDRTAWIENLVTEPSQRSNTSVCLKLADPAADPGLIKAMVTLLETEGVAFDINGYRDAPPGLRIWCGATVETADIEALTGWLDWAHAAALAGMAPA
ncbi:MAG: phosphoserine aminotransferase, partial [Pseudomonadota bacterium]